MKLFSNKLFLGGLIGCLILIVGMYFFVKSQVGNPLINSLPEDVATIHYQPKRDTSLKAKDNAIKPVTNIYYKGTTTPKMTDLEMWAVINTHHTGPQTVEALMESYHVMYLQSKRHREIDEVVPPEQWLQSLLDKGYTILSYLEYVQYMDVRVAADRLDVPQVRQLYSETFGIPETDIERLKELYLENELLFLERKNAVERTTDEPIAGGYFIGDKFLPVYRDRTVVYVQRFESAAKFLGTRLSDAQRFNLFFRGIEPEGVEVIYIDEMGGQLSEKPEPPTREEVRKMMAEGETPPPEEWWDPNAPVPDSEDFEKFLPPEKTDTELYFRKQRAREEFERAREEFERHAEDVGRQPEFEQFMREVRQLEKFATMSDAEIAAELEKQLRQQLLPGLPTEASLEDALREKITPKPLTAERFNKAKQILQNYGPKEGLRRLTQADPELAEYFRRNPQKVPPPKRSQPSNADDSQKE